MKKKIYIMIGISVLIFCSFIFSIVYAYTDSEVQKNRKTFSNVIKNITTEEVTLQEVTDFEWEKAYTFAPYMSKSEIEDIIGFSSKYIYDTISDEGNTNLVFVKGNQVVCNISGSTDSLGYSINFGEFGNYICINASEKCFFRFRTLKIRCI